MAAIKIISEKTNDSNSTDFIKMAKIHKLIVSDIIDLKMNKKQKGRLIQESIFLIKSYLCF